MTLSISPNVSTVNDRSGAVALDKSDVGLSNVDNTSDLNKPVSTATQTALDGKAPASHVGDIGNAHGVATSANAGFMAAADKAKLDGIAAGATNYVHPTGDGNLHVPATGTSSGGKVLRADGPAGSISWNTLTASDVGAAASTHTHAISDVTGLQATLDAKAPLASPAFSGTPTAPTAAAGTDTTQVATTAFTKSEVASYAPSKTGTGASGTWGISITGNAATVTNGVYTNGTYADPAWITSINYSKLTGTVPTWNQNTTGSAATLTTARSFTIGSTSKTFNGSADVSWSLAEIGAQPTLVSGTTIKTINSNSLLGSGDISITASSTNENIVVTSTNTAAGKYNTYVCTASLTLTLPATPSAGDWINLSNRSATNTIVIARNGENIMGIAEDLTIDVLEVGLRLVYADATRGWIIL